MISCHNYGVKGRRSPIKLSFYSFTLGHATSLQAAMLALLESKVAIERRPFTTIFVMTIITTFVPS